MGRRKIPPRVPMPMQAPVVRRGNFHEVALGYTREQAMAEASRCLQCKKPTCQSGCPVEVDCKGFIAHLAQGDVEGAFAVIRHTNSLPAVCGRVCPQEKQCERACKLAPTGEPIAIGRLERFVADAYYTSDACASAIAAASQCRMPQGDVRVACVGSGPSSLTAAGLLAALGAQVTVFEGLHEIGGVLVYGIPEFRLPKRIVATEVEHLRRLGVEFRTNWVVGQTIGLRALLERGYQAVFVGTGAGLPQFPGIPGESLLGVYSANEYLTRVNLMRAYEFPRADTPLPQGRRVTVIGGGNVAMDAARTALRLGALEVTIVYRRTQAEMPCRQEELEHAVEEGVRVRELVAPVAFEGDGKGWLAGLRVEHMVLGEPDDSGRRRPISTGTTEVLPTDLCIIGIGTGPNPVLLRATPELARNRWGYIVTDPETGETSIPMVFAGGDIVTGAATVVLAMGAGRRAAQEIARRLGLV
ncbi:MAG: NADPH-dependent glutamate synthase [Desulfomicrobiaceae bacterium]|nr:NADPH-dependent glutamate synthase [Desulfomicrobiaceae bacterium]